MPRCECPATVQAEISSSLAFAYICDLVGYESRVDPPTTTSNKPLRLPSPPLPKWRDVTISLDGWLAMGNAAKQSSISEPHCAQNLPFADAE